MSETPMNLLLKTIDELSEHPMDEGAELTVSDCEIYYDQFAKIYENSDFRHSYSVISRKLESYTPDVYSSIPLLLLNIIEYTERMHNTDENEKRIYRVLQKLLDHLELEGIRLDRMQVVKRCAEIAKRDIENADKRAVDIDLKWKKIEGNVESTRKQVRGIHSQSITILGIFSALVFGVMMEVAVFTNAFAVLNESNFSKILFFLSFFAICMFDTTFLLLYAISKIAGFSLAIDHDSSQCLFCQKKHTWIRIAWHKYPYVLLFNILLLAFCLCFFIYMITRGII